VKESFRPILLAKLATAQKDLDATSAACGIAPANSALKEQYERDEQHALGFRDGISACIAAWDKFLDAIKS